MRLQTRRLALTAAAALTLAAATVAVAQDGPPPPGMPPLADDGPGAPDGPGGPGGPGGPPMMVRHRFDPEARAQHLRDVLQLRADQDGALKAYLDATGPQGWGDRLKREKIDGPPKALTTPERLDLEAEHLARAAEAFKARAAATRAFYAALSPSQQKAFDALGPMAGGHGPGPRRMEIRRFKGGPDGPRAPGALETGKPKAG